MRRALKKELVEREREETCMKPGEMNNTSEEVTATEPN